VSDERWLSDYLLGEGSEAERAAAARRLAADPKLRARAVALGAVTDRLSALPPAAWAAVAEPPAPVPTPARRRRAVPQPALAALAALVLLAAGIGIGVLVSSGGRSPAGGRAVALRPLAGAPASARGIARITGSGRLALSVRNLPRAGAGHYYEAWLMTSTRRLVPLGSFRVVAGGRARLVLELPAPATDYRYFDVSLQNAAAGVAHSHDSVLRGATAG
jgi:anti-sigma factor RsiW